MKRIFPIMMILIMLLSLCACGDTEDTKRSTKSRKETEETATESTEKITEPQSGTESAAQPPTTPAAESTETTGLQPLVTATTSQPATQPEEPEKPAHSPLYISGVETDDMIRWFDEVCMDAEFVNSGNATLVQKWASPVYYTLLGAPTPEDEAAVSSMASMLNGISGFPGMYQTSNPDSANLKIHFVSEDEMMNILGTNFYGCDGGVTIWWDGAQQIYSGVICVRTDLEQYVRNSVIKEEIYNGMGPLQDTDLRSDSLIYSGYSTPQQPTQVDKMIVTLLYNTKVRCGMNMEECNAVLRELYY